MRAVIPLRTLLTLVGVLSVSVPVVSLTTFSWWRNQQTAAKTAESVNALSDALVERSTQSVVDLANLASAQLRQQVELQLSVADDVLARTGGYATVPETRLVWNAQNQVDHSVSRVELPAVALAGSNLDQTFEFERPVPVVDEIGRVTRGVATVFQRMNDAGDMLRIATSVRGADGRRAISTYIPARQSDGSATPVVATVLRGETYIGRAQVVGQWMTTGYRPIKNARDEVIGMLFVGVPEAQAFAQIADAVRSLRVGRTGSALVLNTRGADRGRIVISSDKSKEGQSLWDETDADGRAYVQEIIAHGQTLRSGETALARPTLSLDGHSTARVRHIRYLYHAPLDWIIAVSLDEEEVLGPVRRLQADHQHDLRLQMILGLAALVLATAGSVLIGRDIGRRLHEVASKIADEARLATDGARQVAGTSRSLAEDATSQAASVEETSATLEEISGMTKSNAEHAATAKGLAAQTRLAADQGADNMARMREAMDAIQASSEEIRHIIKTSDEIAFQTNLLALNAAVEAARAGQAGAGFAVVANEVRALAQRSAESAQETARRVEDASRKSRHGVEICTQVSTSLSAIVGRAREMDELVGRIADASREQTQGIAQLNVAITHIDKITQSNAAGAEECAAAAETLNNQAENQLRSVQTLRSLMEGARRR